MKMIRSLLVVLVLLISVSAILAQDTGSGQFCIQAFEDRNENGSQDTGEPALVQGVTANLKDSSGIIVDSATMEKSPTAANGIICFQYLTAGQYAITVSSAEFSATTPSEFVTVVSETGVPSIFYFGAKRIVAEAVPATTSTADSDTSSGMSRAQLESLLFGVIGAVIAMGAMAVLGAIIYAGVFGKRLRQYRQVQAGYAVPPTTGSMPPVGQTGQYMPYAPPSTGSMPPVGQTGQYAPPSTGSMPPVEPPVDPDDTGQYNK